MYSKIIGSQPILYAGNQEQRRDASKKKQNKRWFGGSVVRVLFGIWCIWCMVYGVCALVLSFSISFTFWHTTSSPAVDVSVRLVEMSEHFFEMPQ